MSKVISLIAVALSLSAGLACSDDDNKTPASAAPGAALKCTSSGKDAFDTYGAAAFVAVNEAIVANVFAELGANGTVNLGDSFTKIGTGVPPSTTDPADSHPSPARSGLYARTASWPGSRPLMNE